MFDRAYSGTRILDLGRFLLLKNIITLNNYMYSFFTCMYIYKQNFNAFLWVWKQENSPGSPGVSISESESNSDSESDGSLLNGSIPIFDHVWGSNGSISSKVPKHFCQIPRGVACSRISFAYGAISLQVFLTFLTLHTKKTCGLFVFDMCEVVYWYCIKTI